MSHRSLSVLVPVHNAQGTLEHQVLGVLDVLPELAGRFDLLIVDDGSTDHTPEVAHDLTLRYPQVTLARHRQRRGLGQAIRTGLALTDGDMVLVHDTHPDGEPADLPKLWQLTHARDVILGRRLMEQGREANAWLTRLFAWAAGTANKQERPRDAQAGRALSGESLARLRFAAAMTAPAKNRPSRATRADQASRATQVARPNYLERLRRFALDE